MSDAAAVNRVLEREAPALSRCLSEYGRSLVFPHGIPYQAAQAKSAEINATIGQLTDGHGAPMTLDPLSGFLDGLDPATSWLYAPISGPLGLRQKWLARQLRLAGDPAVATGMPLATHGLTHAVSLIASLIADPELDVVIPRPCWGNYKLIVRLAGGGRVVDYDFFDDQGRFDLAGLESALGRVRSKALVILNFPNNPTGYVPTPAEAAAITELVASRPGPTIALVDDAYQGWVYDTDRQRKSIFWQLAATADPERLHVFKVDGATKELAFFSSRVGFATTTLTGDGAAALESKLKCQVRGTVGSVSGPALAIIDHALEDPGLDAAFEARRLTMARRANLLAENLRRLASPGLQVLPFHGAFFVVARVPDAEVLRRTLLQEHSAGVVAFPDDGMIRLAYCSLAEEAIEPLVERIGRALG